MTRLAPKFIFGVVRALLLLYPRRFRERHGAELRRIYIERVQRRPARATPAVLLDTLLETLRDAPGAHLDERRRRKAFASREAILPTSLELRQTVRSLVRRPAFSLVVIVVLALGIGANTAIFSLVRGVMLSPLPFPEPDRLVRIWGTYEGRLSTGGTLSYPDIIDMSEHLRSLDGVAAYDEWTVTLTGDDRPQRLDGALVSASYFDVLGVQPSLGRLFRPEDDVDGQDRVVVLHHGFWKSRYGGDRSVIGRTAVLNGHAHEIIGVAPADFEDPDLSDGDPPPQVWRPLGLVGASQDDQPIRGSSSYVAVARLAADIELETAQAELTTLMSRLEAEYPDSNHDRNAALVSLQAQLVDDADQSLLLLLGAVGFLLAIAVANVTSMMLGRAAERAGDSALRCALGAGRLALLRHGMLEGAILALLGGAAGIGLAYGLVQVFLNLAGDSLPRADRVEVDATVLAFAVSVSILVSLACGLLPAMRAGGRRVRIANGGPRSVGSAGVLRLRGALVTLQIGMALVLLHGATLLGGSFLRLQQIDVGVQPAGLVTFDLALPWSRFEEAEQRNAFYREVLERLDALPGVEYASSTNILPLSGSFDGMPVKVPSKPSPDPDGAWSAQTRSVSADYFEAAGVPILRGRGIKASDTSRTAPVAVVSQAFAEFFWPDGEALGARIFMRGQEIEVVGVAADTKHMKLVEEPVRHLYLAREQAVVFWQGYWQTVLLRMTGAEGERSEELPHAIRQAVWQVDPDIPIANLASMEQVVDRTVQSPRLRATLILAFAALALLLGAVGVYGVSSYGIATERRALAVRMALGADGTDIARHVLRRVAAWAAVGSVCGLAGAWALGRTVERFLYGVEPLSPALLGAVGVLLLVALVSAWAPTRRAVGIDPASTLRS